MFFRLFVGYISPTAFGLFNNKINVLPGQNVLDPHQSDTVMGVQDIEKCGGPGRGFCL